MTMSLAANLCLAALDPAVLPIPGVFGLDLAPGRRSRILWDPEGDASQVSRGGVPAGPSPQASGVKTCLLDPVDAYARELERRLGSLLDTLTAYDDRIAFLWEQAFLEGRFLNDQSRRTFLDFLKCNLLIQRGHLFLLENGNLRAVWKGEGASRIGLQFLENGYIQYVLFKQRQADLPVSRAYGRDTPLGVHAQISALGLDEALYL